MTPRVVYVEDNADARALIRLVLEDSGEAQVLLAADGRSGLQLIREARPALVLVDLDLPLLGGLELVRELRSDPELAATPIVALTASVMQGERQLCLAAGCAAFVEKPFDVQALRALVRGLVGGARGGGD